MAADPGNWREISRDTSERLERIPGKLVILRVVRPVFVRKDQPYAAPVTAPAPPQFLPGSFLGLQLMVDLVLGKYLYHLPLYRQGKALEWESGVKISNATFCQTLARIALEVETRRPEHGRGHVARALRAAGSHAGALPEPGACQRLIFGADVGRGGARRGCALHLGSK